jgi:hypothetical protein
MVGLAIGYALVVVVGALLLMIGLMGDGERKILIAAGLLVLALCAIFGLQPDFPARRRPD